MPVSGLLSPHGLEWGCPAVPAALLSALLNLCLAWGAASSPPSQPHCSQGTGVLLCGWKLMGVVLRGGGGSIPRAQGSSHRLLFS